jgi:tetratricopeptide (TPR) repeat protein
MASSDNDSAELVRAHTVISWMLNTRGVYEEGANHARQAITLTADNAWAHYWLAQALNGLRRFTEAVSSAKAAIRLSDGKDARMHFTLADAYFAMKQWPEAVQAFTKAAELEPTDAASAYNVAASYHNQQYYSDALKWYRETLKRDPNHPDKAEIQSRIARLFAR